MILHAFPTRKNRKVLSNISYVKEERDSVPFDVLARMTRQETPGGEGRERREGG